MRRGFIILLWLLLAVSGLAHVPQRSLFVLPVGGFGPASSVTVNGQAAARYADFTWASGNGFTLTNGVNAFTIAATRTNGGSVTNTLSVNLPASGLLQYDRNGNLTNDGWRSFEYDTDNQLVAVSVSNTWRFEFVYDGLGRKCIERGYGWQAGGWSKTNETRFIYDGMLAIQERGTNSRHHRLHNLIPQ